ncbi:hypothetical protein [Bowmanella denitrificans]|uniref:hypothetical protein n=1 Tax=Bowmanella denitrificans TaxID=366582 RepID=UPI000C99FC1D|nr:hypothetical protein [Bowmanella denitrificans]
MQVTYYQAELTLAQQRDYRQERQVLFNPNPSAGASVAEMPSLLPATGTGITQPAAAERSNDGQEIDADYRQSIKKRLIELLSGKKLDWYSANMQPAQGSSQADTMPDKADKADKVQRQLLIVERTHDYQAYQLGLAMTINTAAGETLSLNAELYWQQLNVHEQTLMMTQAQLQDPLVLNFDWRAVEFSGHTGFDLD